MQSLFWKSFKINYFICFYFSFTMLETNASHDVTFVMNKQLCFHCGLIIHIYVPIYTAYFNFKILKTKI